MEEKDKPPARLTDFKGNAPRVTAIKGTGDEADILATDSLVKLYTTDGVFKCPRCPYTTKDRDEAVYHLAEEVNKALDHLAQKRE